jgi:hypothetical protein
MSCTKTPRQFHKNMILSSLAQEAGLNTACDLTQRNNLNVLL